MRKVILNVTLSPDGYIEGPNGEFDWCFTDLDYGMSDFFKQIDSVFMGRKSYELTLNIGEVATAGFPNLTYYVFSSSLQKVQEGKVLINSNWKQQVWQIKEQPGRDICLFGGASLVASFLNESLIDEYRFAVHPVVPGSGKPLFTGLKERRSLQLAEAKTWSTGLGSLKCVPGK